MAELTVDEWWSALVKEASEKGCTEAYLAHQQLEERGREVERLNAEVQRVNEDALDQIRDEVARRGQAEAREAKLREALDNAWDRMDRARGILLDRDELGSWAMLDTKLDRAALAASPEPLIEDHMFVPCRARYEKDAKVSTGCHFILSDGHSCSQPRERHQFQIRSTSLAASPEPEEEQWICPCNYMNIGPICTHCGRPRKSPEPAPCAECGCLPYQHDARCSTQTEPAPPEEKP